MNAPILAWHITAEALRDGRPVPPIGEWLTHDREPVICEHGYHASFRLSDALGYIPHGALLVHRVELEGVTKEQPDKVVARRRRIVASYPFSLLIVVQWARECSGLAEWYAAAADAAAAAAAAAAYAADAYAADAADAAYAADAADAAAYAAYASYAADVGGVGGGARLHSRECTEARLVSLIAV